MPGSRIGQVHGTSRPADPETGARAALVFAMYHPAAALRTAAIERESFEDIARVPSVLVGARERRAAGGTVTPAVTTTPVAAPAPADDALPPSVPASDRSAPPPASVPALVAADPAADDASQLTLF
jgi:hypothetical protein